MTLDKNRKYEFAGDVYRWDGMHWIGPVWKWTTHQFEHFVDKGLVKEVREPIVGRGRVSFNGAGDWVSPGTVKGLCGLTEDQARSRTFDIVATEVLP